MNNKQQRRAVRIDMYWEGEEKPAVSVLIGDFFCCSIRLVERFASDEGFVWNKPSDYINEVDPNSEQAEAGTFKGARISKQGKDYKGSGFITFSKNKGGYVQWYRENDGDAMTETLNIRYSCQVNKEKGRQVDVIVNDKVIVKDLLLPNTGSWGKHWAEVAVEIPIVRGANTIKLQSVGTGGALIDQISYGN